MRVDWSQNLITTAYELDTVAGLKAFADRPLNYEPVAYYVEDPNNADRPWFSRTRATSTSPTRSTRRPNTVTTPWGDVPACFFSPDVYGGSYPDENCNPVEVKLRLSFRKVEDTDYEPVHWDGQRQNMFGMFTTASRLGYDRLLRDRRPEVVPLRVAPQHLGAESRRGRRTETSSVQYPGDDGHRRRSTP